MIVYCSKCQINWAALLKCERTEEDTVECCPLCLTDWFLEDGNDITSYFMCPVTANIFETGTNKELIREQKIPVFHKTEEKPAMKMTQEAYQRMEDAAIDDYHKSGNPEDYFKAFRK